MYTSIHPHIGFSDSAAPTDCSRPSPEPPLPAHHMARARDPIWRQLETEFARTQQSFSCDSEQYMQRINALPTINLNDLSMLSLKLGSSVLMYGHSYLRELVVNILIGTVLAHGASSFVGGQNQAWTGWQPPGTVDYGANISHSSFPGCTANTSNAITRQLVKKCNLSVNKSQDNQRSLYGTVQLHPREITTMVINYAPLQNPTCHAELDTFLELGNFDTVAFMVPHGNAFDQYVAMKAANKTAPPPINLANATWTDQKKLELQSLAKIFAARSPFVVYVHPWHLQNEEPMDFVNHTQHLNDYAEHDAGYCYFPNCSPEGPEKSPMQKLPDGSHQCNPGDLTIAARDLMQMIQTRRGIIPNQDRMQRSGLSERHPDQYHSHHRPLA